MADSHLQVNHNGSLETRKTVLWATSEAEKKEVLLQIFSQPNWTVERLEHIEGSYWKVETKNQTITYKINLYVSSVRDEARQLDEYKMQLGNITPIVENGWITLIMGIYTISEGTESNEYLLSAYNKDRFRFETNPSIRGTRTQGLQMAKILGFHKTDISYLFRPEFIYYYVQNQESLNYNPNIAVANSALLNTDTLPQSRQIIYYGAPGTGKSHKIKEQLEGVLKENIFRITFHPDSDYSTFVGAYKPSRGKKPLYGLNGGLTVRLNDGEDLSEETITYKFIPQAFLCAYMQAYKNPDENVYLIIEEINRGNCAQIFGDLFQLLDRDESGVSEYTIKADADLRSFLEDKFGEDSDAIKDGELCLPSNLYIYATMNTSDQSLFPIDSAFKRRWDWEYEPIKYKNTDWSINIQDRKYSWVSFQRIINGRIFEANSSEDKMLGDYFVNPADGKITEKMLLNKILFYLWNDVCKDGEGEIFKVSDTEDISFSDLHGEGGAEKLIAMMEYLQIQKIE